MDVELEEKSIDHEVPDEHPPNTPLVIYGEVSSEEASRAVLHYRTRTRWHEMPMRRAGAGYAATIPCETLRHPGSVSYYIEILDAAGNVIEGSGSKLEPYAVPIEEGAKATAHVPDQPPPAACSEPEEAEPECDDPSRPCGAPSKPASKKGPPDAWLSLTLSQDSQIASGNDICSRTSQLESGYSCFRAQGSQYLGTPQTGTGGQGGGFELATTRALAGLDYAIADTFTVGVRAGYVLRGGGPKPAGGSAFLPLHGEGRLSYWFSDRAYDADGVAPFVVGAFGIGQIDSQGDVTVQEDPNAPRPTAQLDNPPTQDLTAWKKSGVGFAALGVGVFIATGDAHGFLTELRGSYLFPSPGVAISASLGYAFGL